MVSVLDSERSGFKSWPGHCVVFLGQDTLLSQCFSPHRSKWVPANCQGNLTKCWGVTCDGLASHPGGVAIFFVATETGYATTVGATRLVCRLN